MPDYKQLSLSQILIGERQRPIDRDYASVIGASMKQHGQLQPIVVRATPAAQRPYTLVIGGHRCMGAEIHEIETLDAIVVKANGADAQLLELAENLHRRDLSVLDRAYFVQAYRDLWESKFGAVSAGKPNSAKLALLGDGEKVPYCEAVADKLGLSKRSAQRLDEISSKLHPELRSSLQHSPAADNQSQLLALAKLEPQKQRQVALALKTEPDVKKALAIVDPAPRLAAGFGFWQMAFGSKADLTAANLRAAYTAMTNFTDDEGRKLNIKPTHLIVGNNNHFKARDILMSEQVNGTTNVDRNLVALMHAPMLG